MLLRNQEKCKREHKFHVFEQELIVLKLKNLQIRKLLKIIDRIECEKLHELKGVNGKVLWNFYLELILHPIEFTTAGLYTINLPFLASVS